MFSEINIELTSRCNKKCQICPRWQNDIVKGDMSLVLLQIIERQLESNVVIHFHNNGEPLLYPDLGFVFDLFSRQITHFDTNGILLLEKAKEIEKCKIISISIIQDDPIGINQLYLFKEYLKIKPDNQKVVARCVGNIDDDRMKIIEEMNVPIVKRILHDKSGRNTYTKEVIKPEDFICRDFLNHPAIDYMGNFYMCVKYDPKGEGILGNLYHSTIKELWYSERRMKMLENHLANRNEIEFCKNCEYYGYPNS